MQEAQLAENDARRFTLSRNNVLSTPYTDLSPQTPTPKLSRGQWSYLSIALIISMRLSGAVIVEYPLSPHVTISQCNFQFYRQMQYDRLSLQQQLGFLLWFLHSQTNFGRRRDSIPPRLESVAQLP